ncbi:MAG: Flp family type IVb pilin [Hyphomonas sp.]|nr:Flp family type IVb pilin [Hyphomonas sp.]HRX73586.1 Flp family type IVb pilin [Hyphomonas sp.]
MKAARKQFARFLADDRGATAIEYALIAGIMVIAVVGGATAIGTGASSSFSNAADSFPA